MALIHRSEAPSPEFPGSMHCRLGAGDTRGLHPLPAAHCLLQPTASGSACLAQALRQGYPVPEGGARAAHCAPWPWQAGNMSPVQAASSWSLGEIGVDFCCEASGVSWASKVMSAPDPQWALDTQRPFTVSPTGLGFRLLAQAVPGCVLADPHPRCITHRRSLDSLLPPAPLCHVSSWRGL